MNKDKEYEEQIKNMEYEGGYVSSEEYVLKTDPKKVNTKFSLKASILNFIKPFIKKIKKKL